MASKISEKIASNLHRLKDESGLTWNDISTGAFITPKRLENCLIGQAEFKASEVFQLATFFNKTTDYLYRGTDEENSTVAADLGLSNDAIEFLKDIASSKNDDPLPVGWSDGWTDEEEVIVTSPDEFCGRADVEAVYPSEIHTIVNFLLSDPKGKSLLSMLFKYVSIDPTTAFAKPSLRSNLKNISVPVDEILFSSLGNNHVTAVSVWTIPYAIKDMIGTLLDEIKKEIHRDTEKKEEN